MGTQHGSASTGRGKSSFFDYTKFLGSGGDDAHEGVINVWETAREEERLHSKSRWREGTEWTAKGEGGLRANEPATPDGRRHEARQPSSESNPNHDQ